MAHAVSREYLGAPKAEVGSENHSPRWSHFSAPSGPARQLSKPVKDIKAEATSK
jgi:hypothetical protein